MSIQINNLTNGAVHLDGQSVFGKAEEFTLPTIKHKMQPHLALGMYTTIELPTGMEALESRMKLNAPYADIIKRLGSPFNSHAFQIRGSTDRYDSTGRVAQQPYVCHVRGMIKEMPMGEFKAHEKVTLDLMFTIHYLKLVMGNETVIEIDALAGIFNVANIDELATYRRNLGLA